MFPLTGLKVALVFFVLQTMLFNFTSTNGIKLYKELKNSSNKNELDLESFMDLEKMDKNLKLFLECIRQIETLAFNKSQNPREELFKFLKIHDQILTLFNSNSLVEERMVKVLLELLKKSLKAKKQASIDSFPWGHTY